MKTIISNEGGYKYYKHFRSLTLILLAFTCITTSSKITAQTKEYIEYNGTVRDASSKDPIAFVSMEIQGTNIASVTNSEGKFSLKVPQTMEKAKVQISAVGYQRLLIILADFNEANTIIELNPQGGQQLDEVNIQRPSSAEALVRSVFKNRKDNYFDASSNMVAFYRETIKRRRTNVSLAEAVINIEKRPYTRGGRDRVNLYKARKKTDYNKLDTLALKLEGGPFNALFADVMKYPEYFFSEDFIPDYDFNFGKSLYTDDKLTYVVNFQQKENITEPLYYGKLYIDANTKAITSAVYSLNLENDERARDLFIRKKPNNVDVEPLEANYRVDYRQKDGKWFYGYSNIQLEFKVDWDRKLFNSRYLVNSEMLITDWRQETKGLDIYTDEKFKTNTILADEASGFNDPDFWGAYNVIEPEKSIESAIEKIQRQLREK